MSRADDPDDLRGRLPSFLPDVPEIRQDFADYLGKALAFDAAVGVLLDDTPRLHSDVEGKAARGRLEAPRVSDSRPQASFIQGEVGEREHGGSRWALAAGETVTCVVGG